MQLRLYKVNVAGPSFGDGLAAAYSRGQSIKRPHVLLYNSIIRQ